MKAFHWSGRRSNQQLKIVWMIAGVAMSLSIVTLWWCLVVRPMETRNRVLEDQLVHSQQLADEWPTIEARLAEYRIDAAAWSGRDDLRLQQSTANYDLAEFLQWTHDQARACELILRDFRPSGHDSLPGYEGHKITLNGQGEYGAVCEFLNRLRLCPRMHRITNVEILPRNQDGTVCSLSLQLSILAQVNSESLTRKVL